MKSRTCSCCGAEAVVLLKAGKGSKSPEPTIVCHRCDAVGIWPSTRRALRRHH